jgi:hypothetical protein
LPYTRWSTGRAALRAQLLGEEPGLDDLVVNRPFRQLKHPARRVRAGAEPAFDLFAGRFRCDPLDLGNIHGREESGEKIDLPLAQHAPQERILAADVAFWIDRVNDEGKSVHTLT